MTERKIMVTSDFTYRNPADRPCFRLCVACARCANKGMKLECDSCSGREDVRGRRVPHPDDRCDCVNGVFRWVTQNGELIVAKYNRNPFKGSFKKITKSVDEKDWEEYVENMRDRLDDPTWDPIEIIDEGPTKMY